MLKCHQYKDIKRLLRYFEQDFVYDGADRDAVDRDLARVAAGLAPSWQGKAAISLQLPSLVTSAAFESLGRNLHPLTKEQLTARMRVDRIAAYDLTFSMPKGVSLLYAIGGHSQLLVASTRAIQSTMAEAEHQMRVRVRDGGDRDDRLSKNLVYALIPHRLARPQDGVADPQVHAHAVVFNLSRDYDKQVWKAGKFFHMVKNMPYLQTVFHQSMRRELEVMGYRTVTKGKFWDLEGIPDGLVEKFSRRQAAIKSELDKRGATSGELASKLALFYREHKDSGIAGKDLWNAWTRRLNNVEWDWISGYKPGPSSRLDLEIEPKLTRNAKLQEADRDSILSSASVERRSRTSRGSGEAVGGETDTEGDAESNASEAQSTHGTAAPKLEDAELIVAFESLAPGKKRLAKSVSLKAVVRFAAERAFERLAAISELDLIKQVMAVAAEPTPDVAKVRAEIERLPYERREVAGQIMFVDPAAIEAEKSLIQKVVAGRAQFGPLIPRGLLGNDVAPKSFPSSMRDAFARVAASKDLVTIVEAFPGEASREFLSLLRPRLPIGPVVDPLGALTLSGQSRAQALTPAFRVGYVVISPSGGAVSEGLRDAGVVAPLTVAHFLSDLKARNDARGGVVIVDQAHLLTTRDANRLVDAAKDIRARLVLVASDAMMRAPAPGNVPRLLMETTGLQPSFTGRGSGVNSPHLELVEIAAQGRPQVALDQLKVRGQCLEVPKEDFATSAVAKSLGESTKSRGRKLDSLIVTPSREQCHKMNEAVRSGMKERGLLGKGKQRDQLRPIRLSDADKRRPESYSKGMVIEFNEKATRKFLGVPLSRTYKPGQQWSVIGQVGTGVMIRRGTRTGFLPREHATRFDVFEKHKSELAKGDTIRFTRRNFVRTGLEDMANKTFGAFKVPRRLVEAGRPYTVTGFTRAGDVKLKGGVIMPKAWAHWTHDYARTPSQVQGIQRDRIVFVATGLTKNETMGRSLVAAMAAAKVSFQVVTDRFQQLRERVAVDTRRLTATEAAHKIIPPAFGIDINPNGMRYGSREEQAHSQKSSRTRERDFERE